MEMVVKMGNNKNNNNIIIAVIILILILLLFIKWHSNRKEEIITCDITLSKKVVEPNQYVLVSINDGNDTICNLYYKKDTDKTVKTLGVVKTNHIGQYSASYKFAEEGDYVIWAECGDNICVTSKEILYVETSVSHENVSNCGDGIDNDNDGKIDCEDSDCNCEYSCNLYGISGKCQAGTCEPGYNCIESVMSTGCMCVAQQIENFCSDSDGGIKPMAAGNCQDAFGKYYDSCASAKLLVEYHCQGDANKCYSNTIDCSMYGPQYYCFTTKSGARCQTIYT